MAELTIELTEDQETRLQELAAEDRRTQQELVGNAVDEYIKKRPAENVNGADPYEPLSRIIGLYSGSTDASEKHDDIYREDR